MQRGCTAVRGGGRGGVSLECPVSLGENFENVGFGGFSKTRTFFFRRGLAVYEGRLNSLQAKRSKGCRRITAFHKLTLKS